jgi:glucose-1-phosphate thymidylyltransferase
MIQAIILAADYGVRLDSSSGFRVSSLLPIKGTPVIEYIANRLQAIEGLGAITIVANSRSFSQFQEWKDNYTSQVPITIIDNRTSNHKDSRGAIKDLFLAIETSGTASDALVIGADNLFSFSLDEFINFARSVYPSNVIGVYNLNGRLRPRRFGIVKLDNERKVIDFWEKPASLNGSRLVSTCLYFFPKEKLSLLKKYTEQEKTQLSCGHYIRWLSQTDSVKAYEFEGLWFDVGDSDSYADAVFEF